MFADDVVLLLLVPAARTRPQQVVFVSVEWMVTKGEWWEGQCGSPRRPIPTTQRVCSFFFWPCHFWIGTQFHLCNLKIHLTVGGEQSRPFLLKFSLHPQSFVVVFFFCCCVLATIASIQSDRNDWREQRNFSENSPKEDAHAFFKLFSPFCFFFRR